MEGEYKSRNRPFLLLDSSPESFQAIECLRESGVNFSYINNEDTRPVGPVLFTDVRTFRGMESIERYIRQGLQDSDSVLN